MSCIVIRKKEVKSDRKLLTPNNNGRKIFATSGAIQEFGEREIKSGIWTPGDIYPTKKGGLEISTFTETAKQDRHMHKETTEIYTVLEGGIFIAINNDEHFYLDEGDEIIIYPGTIHYLSTRYMSLIRVHSINSYGAKDKFVQLQKNGKWCCWAYLSDEERETVFNG